MPLPPILAEAEALFARLGRERVDSVVIGGVAAILWGTPTDTVDIDLVVLLRGPETLHKAFRVLKGLDYFPTELKAKDGRFLRGGREFRGWSDFERLAAPAGNVAFMRFASARRLRVDFNLTLTGVSPEKVWENRLPTRLGRTRVWVISFEDLVRNKRAIAKEPSSDEAERLKAQRHLQLLDLAVRAGRGERLMEGVPQRRYRKVLGKTRLVEVTKVEGKERLRFIV